MLFVLQRGNYFAVGEPEDVAGGFVSFFFLTAISWIACRISFILREHCFQAKEVGKKSRVWDGPAPPLEGEVWAVSKTSDFPYFLIYFVRSACRPRRT